jgi:hypothetical protein
MTKFRRVAGACAIAAVATASVLPPSGAFAKIVKTRISLLEFKQAYQLSSVNKLIDPIKDGVKFSLIKRGNDGNRIRFSDPNRAEEHVDTTKSFIVYRVNTKKVDPVFASLMQAVVTFKVASPPSIEATISCGLGGTSSAGVNSVTCGDGPTVSPT